MKNKICFHEVWHYDEEDTQCIGDYYSIDVYLDNEKVQHFGDYYDKGYAKLEGFYEGVKFITNAEIMTTKENIADGKY